jgi:hypothetical protein
MDFYLDLSDETLTFQTFTSNHPTNRAFRPKNSHAICHANFENFFGNITISRIGGLLSSTENLTKYSCNLSSKQ